VTGLVHCRCPYPLQRRSQCSRLQPGHWLPVSSQRPLEVSREDWLLQKSVWVTGTRVALFGSNVSGLWRPRAILACGVRQGAQSVASSALQKWSAECTARLLEAPGLRTAQMQAVPVAQLYVCVVCVWCGCQVCVLCLVCVSSVFSQCVYVLCVGLWGY
jgi:hypothetical protein